MAATDEFWKVRVPPVSHAEVESVARELGVEFPADYVDFVTTTASGGGPRSCWIRGVAGEWWLCMVVFPVGSLDLVRRQVSDFVLDLGFFPFASDTGGTILGIDAQTGEVRAWSMDEQGGRPGREDLPLVAGSLKEFFAGLRASPDEAE